MKLSSVKQNRGVANDDEVERGRKSAATRLKAIYTGGLLDMCNHQQTRY
jgi:hypothetical protein